MELVEKYHPDLLYFDGGIPHGQYGMELIAHYLNHECQGTPRQREGVVNVKAGTFVRDYERGVSATMQEPHGRTTPPSRLVLHELQSPQRSRLLVKDAPTVIHTLVDVVSKNGNLLMNFPQRGDGSLYPECENVLARLPNGCRSMARQSSTPDPGLPLAKVPRFAPKGMNELHAPMTSKDIRFTQSKDGKKVYAIVCGVPQRGYLHFVTCTLG